MDISIDETKKIANLAKLSFDEDELCKMQQDLKVILDHFDKLDELEFTECTTENQPEPTSLREDTVGVSLNENEVFRNCKSFENQFFKVPRVIEIKTGK